MDAVSKAVTELPHKQNDMLVRREEIGQGVVEV
jgi:hypothetical protein